MESQGYRTQSYWHPVNTRLKEIVFLKTNLKGLKHYVRISLKLIKIQIYEALIKTKYCGFVYSKTYPNNVHSFLS